MDFSHSAAPAGSELHFSSSATKLAPGGARRIMLSTYHVEKKEKRWLFAVVIVAEPTILSFDKIYLWQMLLAFLFLLR